MPSASACAKVRCLWCLYPRGSESVSEQTSDHAHSGQTTCPSCWPEEGGRIAFLFCSCVDWFQPATRVVESECRLWVPPGLSPRSAQPVSLGPSGSLFSIHSSLNLQWAQEAVETRGGGTFACIGPGPPTFQMPWTTWGGRLENRGFGHHCLHPWPWHSVGKGIGSLRGAKKEGAGGSCPLLPLQQAFLLPRASLQQVRLGV